MSGLTDTSASHGVAVAVGDPVLNTVIAPVLSALERVEGVRIAASVGAAYSAETSVVLLILTPPPVASLALRLRGCDTPAKAEVALSDWVDDAEALLNKHLADPRRVTLADPSVFRLEHEPVRAELAQRLGITMPEVAKTPDLAAGTPPVLYLAAAAMLASDARASSLAEALSGAMLGKTMPPFDTATAAAAVAQHNAADQERALLRANLELHPESTETLQHEIATLRDETQAGKDAEVALLRATNQALARRLQDAKHLSVQREQVLGAALLSETLALQANTAQSEAELARVYNSMSWALTRPLRVVRDKLTRNLWRA